MWTKTVSYTHLDVYKRQAVNKASNGLKNEPSFVEIGKVKRIAPLKITIKKLAAIFCAGDIFLNPNAE